MYDAVIVGSRCAGAATGLLLAREGLDVLLLDRSTFPSDTISTHYLHPPALAALDRWGLIDSFRALGTPAIRRIVWRFGDLELAGFPANDLGVEATYAPRRLTLDAWLLEQAVAAGCEVRERFTVDELLWDGGSVAGVVGGDASNDATRDRIAARIVVGADGMRSFVASQVEAPAYWTKPTLTCQYYTYYAGVEVSENEMNAGVYLGSGAFPTDNELTMVAAACPRSSFKWFKSNVTAHFDEILQRVSPRLHERVHAGERVERIYGTATIPNFFRRPYGPGWVLAGDAGYHKDPLTAMGISDAFRDAELVAQAIVGGLTNGRLPEELAEYERVRNEKAYPFYEWTTSVAGLAPPNELEQAYFAAIADDDVATSEFFGVPAATVLPSRVFDEEQMRLRVGGVPALGASS